MILVMEVTGIEKMSHGIHGEGCYRITLTGKSSTIYDNQAYVKVNEREAKGIALGDKWALAPLEAIDHRELAPADVRMLADMEHAGITDLDTREMDS